MWHILDEVRPALVIIVMAVLVGGCTNDSTVDNYSVRVDETAATQPPHAAPTSTSQPLSDSEVPDSGTAGIVEWTNTGTVIDRDGPILCAAGVMTSLPPQCSGVPVVGLDWSDVSDAESQSGVTWATMTLFGTFDGAVFELTRPPATPEYPPEEPFVLPLPCDEPADGWKVVNAATANNESDAVVYAQSQSEFMGNWVYRLPTDADARSVKVFTFAGQTEEHRAALRDLYGGPLCVAEAHRSLTDLAAIRTDAIELITSPEAVASGIHLVDGAYGDTIDIVHQRVALWVFAAEPGAEAWLESRLGQGVIELHSQLQRVDG